MAKPGQMPAADVAYPRIVAAIGPKMLALAGEISDGAMPAMLPPEYTAQARQVLGPDKLLVIGLSVVADEDPERARATARQATASRVNRPGLNYASTLSRFGYSEQDITDVSDRLVDALVPHGDAIPAKVREHLAAGADHVVIMPNVTDYETGIAQLERIAPDVVSIA